MLNEIPETRSFGAVPGAEKVGSADGAVPEQC